jgi:uncharacterized protein YceH (UPF0502 family)
MTADPTQVAGSPAPATPRWRPISAIDRRVLGVLGEKAKTTPDVYPMTLSGLRSGANQKNNRYPLMETELEDLQESLDRLRSLGAVSEVQGGSRVAKFRHLLYEWLGVNKVEMAVMVELLLRGAQTEGELRGRAARMEPIADLGALRPVLNSLKEKGLIISLTPEGRGHALTHALYEPRELEKVRREFEPMRGDGGESAPASSTVIHAPSVPVPTRSQASPTSAYATPSTHAQPAAEPAAPVLNSLVSTVDQLRAQVEEMQAELARVRKDVDDLWSQFR